MAYWEPTNTEDGTTGLGCIFFDPVVKMKVTNEQLLCQLKALKNSSIIYYTGAVWDKAKIITNAQ